MLTDKTLMPEYSNDKLKVYKVDAQFMQNDKMPHFVGGHSLIMAFIPSGEIWIADDLDEHSCKSTIYYLLVQKRLMASGLNYLDSVKRANQSEQENQDNLDDCIKDELDIVKVRIIEPSYSNSKHKLVHGKGEKHHVHYNLLQENQKKRRQNIGKKKKKFDGDALMRALL